MGQPSCTEAIGQDANRLRSYYAELFDWEIDADNPSVRDRDPRGHTNSRVSGSAAGSAPGLEGYAGHVTFYVEVPDVEASLAKAESLGGERTAARSR